MMYLLVSLFALANAGVVKFEQSRDLGLFNVSAGGVSGTRCPDGTLCPGTDTCCPTTHGFSCCPYVDATCCNDGKHCCARGTVCSGTTCKRTSEQEVSSQSEISMLKLTETVVDKEPNDICPDRSRCPGDHACCPNARGGYSCCPFAGGTCCNDAQHCCPHGYLCKHSLCIRPGLDHEDEMTEVAMLPITEPAAEGSSNTVCPDGSHCSGTDTCCPSTSGFGCCPYVDATCCNDGKHCCSKGSVCSGSGCVKEMDLDQTSSIQHLMMETAVPEIKEEPNDICPDRSRCPGDHACCPNGRGFSCCPFAGGTCCNDAKHCCAHGYVCRGGQCVPPGVDDENTTTELAMLVLTESAIEGSPNTICPDGSICPGTDTCCPSTHGFVCCPYVDATCCNDGQHCCPSGYICSRSSHQCLKTTTEERQTATELITMQSDDGLDEKKSNNICPDGSHCPGDHTCCPTTHGWACCSFASATCCNDAKHCCPQGYICKGGTRCVKTSNVLMSPYHQLMLSRVGQ